MDKDDWAEYMKQLKYNEQHRLSYNERTENWSKYLRQKTSPIPSDASLPTMNKF